MLISIGLVAIAKRAVCDNLEGVLLVPEEKTECAAAFSHETGGQVLQESCCSGWLLFSIACASHLFFFTWDLAAGKGIIESQFGDLLEHWWQKIGFSGNI